MHCCYSSVNIYSGQISMLQPGTQLQGQTITAQNELKPAAFSQVVSNPTSEWYLLSVWLNWLLKLVLPYFFNLYFFIQLWSFSWHFFFQFFILYLLWIDYHFWFHLYNSILISPLNCTMSFMFGFMSSHLTLWIKKW